MLASAGTQIFAANPGDSAHLEEAKKYIREMGLTAEDISLLYKPEHILIVAKRDIE